MPSSQEQNSMVLLLLEEVLQQHMLLISMIIDLMLTTQSKKRKRNSDLPHYSLLDRMPNQVKHLTRIVGFSDTDCIVNLRMDRNTFGRLCLLLRHVGGLSDGKFVTVEEQVAMFISILAHHKKNRIVKIDYWRSGQTISHNIHVVLKAILRLHDILLVRPEPIGEECTDPLWKWFKGCLGALDGTYVNVMVPSLDKQRYRTRKGEIATNILVVCDCKLNFVYILLGWEGSAADSRVLRDAINRPNGLKVPKGTYYLCDNGYANSEGFLTPYKSVRYHLKEWGPNADLPQNAKEIFNTRARNVIERAFGIMKMRWGIFRSHTYYPIKVQNRLFMACFLLHNFIRGQMLVDPIETQLDADGAEYAAHGDEELEFIDTIESSLEWNSKRDEMAQAMWAAHN